MFFCWACGKLTGGKHHAYDNKGVTAGSTVAAIWSASSPPLIDQPLHLCKSQQNRDLIFRARIKAKMADSTRKEDEGVTTCLVGGGDGEVGSAKTTKTK